MKRARAFLSIILTIVCLCLFGCSGYKTDESKKEDDHIVIGITLMNYGFPFFQDMLAMARLTADELGVTLLAFDGKGDTVHQMNIINDMIYAMDIDIICLNPVDSDAISSSVLEANAAGIPIATIDVGTAQGDVVAHISSDNRDIGRVAAEYAIELLAEKYGVYKGTIIVVGYPQITSMRQRVDGFQEIIKDYPEVKLILSDPIKLTSDFNMKLMEDLIQTYSEGTIDIVFGASGTTTSGLLAATEAAGRTDYQIISVDNPPNLIKKLKEQDSVLAGTVVQSPTDMARVAIELCVRNIRGERIDEREIKTKIELITKTNVEQYNKRMEQIEEQIAPYK